jgi:hypothetical protein
MLLLSIELSIMNGFSDRRFFPGLRQSPRQGASLGLGWVLAATGLTAAGLAASGLTALPAAAEAVLPTERQVVALSKALRLKSGQGPGLGTGVYYSDWQIESSVIPQWSKACLGRSLTPLEFATSTEAAESVVLCKLREQLTTQYQAAGSNEALAVQRVVAWWRTGDASRYGSSAIAPFAQDVLALYQKSLANPEQPGKPSVVIANTTLYDRYMSAGYGSTRNNELGQAAIYFQRALDERPKDTFAQNALRDVNRQTKAGAEGDGVVNSDPGEAQGEAVNRQHWTEVAVNGVGDRTLVGTNSIAPVGDRLGYWEYRAFAGENSAFLPVPMDQPLRSALLYRLVSCEAGTVQTRVVKGYGDGRAELYAQDFGIAAAIEQPKADSTTAKAMAFVCQKPGASLAVPAEAPLQVEVGQ